MRGMIFIVYSTPKPSKGPTDGKRYGCLSDRKTNKHAPRNVAKIIAGLPRHGIPLYAPR